MSEEATLDEFVEGEKEHTNQQDDEPHLPEISEIPPDWSLVTVEDIADDLIGGGTPSKSNEEYWGGEIPWASVKDLNGIELAETEDYITESGIENSATNLIPEDSIVISTRMTVGEPFLNKTEMAINQDMKAIIPKTKNVNPLFFVYSLRDKDPYLKSLGRGTTVDGITTNDLALTHLGLPSLSEQRKIATVLYTVDRAIEKTEELESQAERVKAGLTQDLLNHGINNQNMVGTDSRFGLLPESWELQPLKQVGEIVGRTAPEKDDSECWGGDIPWATPSEITSLVGQTIDDTEEHLTEVALEKVSSNLLPPMSVLMTTRATIGECAVNTVEMTTNQGFKNIIPGERLDTWYAYYRLDYESDYLASLSKGSTFPEVGKDTVENFVIPVPPMEEQREIGELLQSVDEQILSYKQTKSQYERLKRGLMQDLLSGKVRTADTNIEVPEEIAQYG